MDNLYKVSTDGKSEIISFANKELLSSFKDKYKHIEVKDAESKEEATLIISVEAQFKKVEKSLNIKESLSHDGPVDLRSSETEKRVGSKSISMPFDDDDLIDQMSNFDEMNFHDEEHEEPKPKSNEKPKDVKEIQKDSNNESYKARTSDKEASEEDKRNIDRMRHEAKQALLNRSTGYFFFKGIGVVSGELLNGIKNGCQKISSEINSSLKNSQDRLLEAEVSPENRRVGLRGEIERSLERTHKGFALNEVGDPLARGVMKDFLENPGSPSNQKRLEDLDSDQKKDIASAYDYSVDLALQNAQKVEVMSQADTGLVERAKKTGQNSDANTAVFNIKNTNSDNQSIHESYENLKFISENFPDSIKEESDAEKEEKLEKLKNMMEEIKKMAEKLIESLKLIFGKKSEEMNTNISMTMR